MSTNSPASEFFRARTLRHLAKNRAYAHRAALLDFDMFEDAGSRGWHFDVDLVRFKLDDRLV